MSILTKDQILKSDDLTTKVVKVPEWGGDVIVTTMSGAGRDQYDSTIYIAGDDGKITTHLDNGRAKLVAATVVDDKGNLLFNVDDVGALGKKSVAALDRVYEVATRLNFLSEKEVQELAKNS